VLTRTTRMLGSGRSRLVLLAIAAVLGLGTFAAPEPAHAGGTSIVVATPGVFVAIGARKPYYPRYRDYGYKDYRFKDHGYRGKHYYHRGYDRHYYGGGGRHFGRSRYDCDRRYRY